MENERRAEQFKSNELVKIRIHTRRGRSEQRRKEGKTPPRFHQKIREEAEAAEKAKLVRDNGRTNQKIESSYPWVDQLRMGSMKENFKRPQELQDCVS